MCSDDIDYVLLVSILGGAVVSISKKKSMSCCFQSKHCHTYAKKYTCLAIATYYQDPNDDPMYTKGDRTERFKLHQFDDAPMLDKWEIPACDVIINNKLGEGCFGSVYRGVIKGPINNPKIPASLKNILCPTVAIKFLKRESNCSEFKWHHNCKNYNILYLQHLQVV